MVQFHSVNNITAPRDILGSRSVHVRENSNVNLTESPDSFESSKNSFNENLLRKFHSTGLFQGYYTMEGSVNDKIVNLKRDYTRTSFFTGNYRYEGTVGEDRAEIIVNGRNVSGKVGDKEINLTYRTAFLGGGFSINGTIDGKEINIAKESPVESAEGENDILALASSLQGMQLRTRNGQFISYDISAQQQIDNMQAAMDAQMAQQQMMMNGMIYY